MKADRDSITLATSRGDVYARLQRVVGAAGAWELHLLVDDDDDLHIIRIDPRDFERLDNLRQFLTGECPPVPEPFKPTNAEVDLVLWHNSSDAGGFSTKLFDLLVIADDGNREQLRSAFPEYVEAFEQRQQDSERWRALLEWSRS
jgi:hypothetical protein